MPSSQKIRKEEDFENLEVEFKDVHVVPDGGWGWVVCLTAALCNGTIFGIINTFGVLYVSLIDALAKDDPNANFKTSLVGSINSGLVFFMSAVASILIDRFKVRWVALVGAIMATVGMFSSAFVPSLWHLYLTYGVLFGVGSSLVYSPSLVILGHYFKQHLGLVNGLVTLGSGVFTVALPIVMKFLLTRIGLRYTLCVLGGMVSLLIIYSLTWKQTFDQRHEELDYFASHDKIGFVRRFLNFEIWKIKGFRVWVLAVPGALFGYFIPFVHLVNHVKQMHPDFKGEILILAIGASSAVSRLIVGRLSDFPCVSRLFLQQIAFVLLGIITAIIPLASSFYELIVITIVMGLSDGCFICLLGPIAFDLVGPTGASQAIGFLLALCSIPMSLGPPLAGIINDRLGSYNLAFYLAGIPPILGAIVMFLIPYKKKVQHGVSEAEGIQMAASANLDALFHDSEHNRTRKLIISRHNLAENSDGGGMQSVQSLRNN